MENLRRIRVNSLRKMSDIKPIIKELEQDLKELREEYAWLESEYKGADYKLAQLDGRMEVVRIGHKVKAKVKLPKLSMKQVRNIAKQLGIKL